MKFQMQTCPKLVLSSLLLMLALGSACGEVGQSGFARFEITPVADTSVRWLASKPIAEGSSFSVVARAVGGPLTIVSEEPEVVERAADGTFVARSVGDATLIARDSTGVERDRIALRVLRPTAIQTVHRADPFGDRVVAPKTLRLRAGARWTLRTQLHAADEELQHGGLLRTEVSSTGVKSTLVGANGLAVEGDAHSVATIHVVVADRPDLRVTHGVAVFGDDAIHDVTFHVAPVGGDQNGKTAMVVWLKAWTEDGKQLLGTGAQWTSLAGHVDVFTKADAGELEATLVMGKSGSKGALKARTGNRDRVFVVDFPAAKPASP